MPAKVESVPTSKTVLAAAVVRCKVYHQSSHPADLGHVRNPKDRDGKKPRCPGWADDPVVQERLLKEALVDPAGDENMFGFPTRIWNAVAGMYFVGVSTNESTPAYNCYPSVPATDLVDNLRMRAERSLEEFLAQDSKAQ
jgi:hypothetical protein